MNRSGVAGRWWPVPLGAFVVAFVLSAAIGVWGGSDVASAGGSPPADPAPTTPEAPAPGAAAFVPAPNGVPSVVLTGDPTPAGVQWFTASKKDGYRPGPARPPTGRVLVDTAAVDQLVCVVVPERYQVSVAVSEPDLASLLRTGGGGGVPERTACRGGWSEPQAVPAVLSFEIRHAP